jgi:hypothetical protein
MNEIQTTTAISEPMQLIVQAMDKGLSIETMEKLFAMQERWEAKKSEKAFFEAITEFQIKCPDLRKTKKVSFGQTNYSFAPLSDIDRQIRQLLHDCGISKRWEIQDNGEKIKVTCIITHVDGHSERTSMESIADLSGSKNPIQARGSAIEYMKRYTLIAALGITTADSDIDGRLPELDVDKLHKQYMDVFNQIIVIDPGMRAAMDPDSWAERTGQIYVKAIARAREILIQKTKSKI